MANSKQTTDLTQNSINYLKGGGISYLKNINFLKVIACLAIVIYHIFLKYFMMSDDFQDIKLYNSLYIMTKDGLRAVELFFIISGFFFSYKLNTSQSLFEFIKHKIIRFYPVLIFLIIVSYFISLKIKIFWEFYSNLFVLFGLNGTSLFYNTNLNEVSQFWYCSSFLWIAILFFYLIKNFDKKIVNLIIVVGIFFSYSFLIQAQAGKIWDIHDVYYHIFHAGLLRAFGGVGVGYLIGEWYKNNKEQIEQETNNLLLIICISVLEFICLYFIINNMFFHIVKCANKFIFVIVFTITLMLFLYKKGIFSRLLERDIFNVIGKYSYSIFMVHCLILHVFKYGFWINHTSWVHSHPIVNLVLILSVIIISGVLTYHLVEKPAVIYLKKALKSN